MAPAKKAASTEVISQDEMCADFVMATNNSSILSKRSVEMSYYPEPHFFRYFTKKPQRRAPLLNRGYWIRMRAMEETVRRFMREPSDKPKFVLNLGCGFDPLPYILLSTDRALCSKTTFVDIDYGKLIVNKKAAIQKSAAIVPLLENVEFYPDESAVQIRSTQYLAIGCDLKNLEKLDRVLRAEILPSNCAILFLAEVSLSYMGVNPANAVINWASKLSNAKDAQFCILEQFFPNGPDHPFASTMMKHYSKLGAPLYSVHEYTSLADQERRFREAGWRHARARSLWDLWSDEEFVPSSLRVSLDAIEPFDEWEDFALFTSHFFLLHASRGETSVDRSTATVGRPDHTLDQSDHFKIIPNCAPPTSQRRFGAVISGDNGFFGYHSGFGQQTRVPTTDTYTNSSEVTIPSDYFPPRDLPARMCHTATSLNENGDFLLVGGRTSPAAAYQDCWLKRGNEWRVGHSLPEPRFRHSATRLTICSDSVLLYGGKKNENTTLGTWLLWSGEGWQTIETSKPTLKARFGACLACVDGAAGVLFGGIGADGTVLEDFWTWRLHRRAGGSLYLELSDQTETMRMAFSGFEFLHRFGATITSTSWGLVVAGGIMPRRLVPYDQEILLLDSKELLRSLDGASFSLSQSALSTIGFNTAFGGPRPLLVGHAAYAVNPESVLILGGGAVCHPFGTFWTEGTWLLTSSHSSAGNNWTVLPRKAQPKPAASNTSKLVNKNKRNYKSTKTVTQIPRVKVESATDFEAILTDGKPVIIEGSDIGPCTELWTKDYLTTVVVVHEAQSENMSFRAKNFSYTTKPFGTFLDEVYAGGRQYLRSISAEQPTNLPANLAVDFPGLKNDFRLPEALSAVVDKKAHSSPLRVSGPVTLWLHYDVMANVLCQIQGEKRLILYPPGDVQHLDIPAGASSSNINIFHNREDGSIASIPHTSPQEALLNRGDILFIPPLWLHTAAPTGQLSVAVNVFFRNLPQGYAAGRDVYGNRDLQAYEKARKDISNLAKSFDGLPPETARFYLLRLADELQGHAEGK